MNSAKVLLIISVALIFSMGLVMVFNTTSAEVLDGSLNISTDQALIKQLVYGVLGIGLGIAVYFVGYQNVIRLSPFLFFLCIICLILVFFPKIGHEVNGAKRWLSFGAFSFQPSEFAKYLIPIYFIHHYSMKGQPQSFLEFLRFLLIFIFPITLILLEPDNGTTAIILTTLMVMFFLFKIRPLFWALPLVIIVLLGSVVAYHMPHVPDRIRVYLHPELDIRGKGHQPYQAKIAAGSGKLFGKGLGQSMQKLNYLPEARSDYIAAIYAEEFGFIGIVLLIVIYITIAFSGFHIAANSKDKKGLFVASIMTFLISFQAFLNLGVVSGLLPSKGTTLPFFSQGGTSLIVNLIAIFLILSVTLKTVEKKI